MAVGQQVTTFFTAVVTAVGAEAANLQPDTGPELTTTSITTTFVPAHDDARNLIVTGTDEGAEARINDRFAAVSAEPPQPESGAGALLRRREQRQHPETQPAEKPAETKPAEPQAGPPAPAKHAEPAAKPGEPAAASPASQPTTTSQPTTGPAQPVTTQPSQGPKPEVWRPLTQEQIEKLTPEEMRTMLIDLDKRTAEATRTLRLNQEQTVMYEQLAQILADKKGAPAHEQIAAINAFFGQAYKDESEGIRGREAAVAEARKAMAGELVNGVPRAIIDAIAGLNQGRKDLATGLDADRAAIDQAQRDSYLVYTSTNEQIAAAKRALWAPTIDLGPLGGILSGGPKEPTPEEVKKAEEKRKADMAKEPMFKPLASITDPAKDADVIAALKPVTVEEALQYVSHGPTVMTPGEMRLRLAELQATMAATELGGQGADAVLKDAKARAEAGVTGAPTADNPVLQRIAVLARTRQDLTDRTLKLETAETGLQQPHMNADQQRDLDTFTRIKYDEMVQGVTAKDQILQKNFGYINDTNVELGKWSESQWAEYRRWEAARQGNLGGVIFGR